MKVSEVSLQADLEMFLLKAVKNEGGEKQGKGDLGHGDEPISHSTSLWAYHTLQNDSTGG